MKKSHTHKIIVTVVIAAVVILFYMGYALLFITAGKEMPSILMFIFAGIPITLIAGMIYVAVQRIKEIEKGEEDDIDNY